MEEMMVEKALEEVAQIIAEEGNLSGQRWTLHQSNLIGRDASCDIVIADRQVSRQHAKISITDEGVILEDLNSKNGTNLNGIKIHEPTLLEDGDEIQIAIAQKFIFLSSDATLPLDQQSRMLLNPEFYETLDQHKISLRQLRLDSRSHQVWIYIRNPKDDSIEEREIIPPLSASQFRLLEKLYENQGLIVSRPELVEKVWGENQVFEVSEQALDALVRRLRKRIAEFDTEHDYIVTVRGHGIRLDNPKIEKEAVYPMDSDSES
jgi:DNA-binding winged helix-turn-helix (wHTH) protein